MGKGILSGLIWGTVVGGVLTAFLSLYVPLAPTPVAAISNDAEPADVAQSAVEAETPSADEAETTEIEAAPAPEVEEVASAEVEGAATSGAEELTATEAQDITSTSAEAVSSAKPEEIASPSSEEATAATVEGIGSAPAEQAAATKADEVAPVTAETVDPVSDPEAGSVDVAQQAPEVASEEIASVTPQAVAPSTSATVVGEAASDVEVADRPQVSTTIAATPEAPVVTGVELPEINSQTDPVTTASTEPKRLRVPSAQDDQPDQVATATTTFRRATPNTSETETVSSDTPITLPAPATGSSSTGVVTNRLPSVTAPTPEEGTELEAEAEEIETDIVDPETSSAIDRFAAEAEIPEGASLFSIVLIDSGIDGIERDKIVALDLPVSIAIDPVRPDAKSAMEAYRAAGMEVLIVPEDLPVAASPSDVAVAIEGYVNIVGEAVALLDPLDGRIQSNRSLLQPVLGAIRDSGHGLLTYDRGLNSAQQAARRESIPAATIYRVLDADLEEAPLIKRYLDRAAFAANQDGSVVVVGRSYPETVTALIEWGLERKDGDLAIVPVSAVMKARAQ